MGTVFKAASGREVKQGDDGSLILGKAVGYLSREAAFDAEEFFRAKRDAELGRWRSAVNPDWVAREVDRSDDGRRCVEVLNERTFQTGVYNDRVLEGETGVETHQTAREYLEAHPGPKPWHDAKHGEVWAVTDTSGEALYRVTSWGRFEQVSGHAMTRLDMPVDHPSITAGRRVWPEDAA